MNRSTELVGWLMDLTAHETVFQSISDRLAEKGRKKREKTDERNKIPNNPQPHLLQAQYVLVLLESKSAPSHYPTDQRSNENFQQE